MNRLQVRKLHRWLGLLTAVQLLAWTISGLYFTLIPIDEIRGNHLLVHAEPPTPLTSLTLLSPSEVARMHRELEGASMTDLTLQVTAGVPIYVIGKTRISAVNGELLGQVTREDAERVVMERTGQEVRSADWVTEVPAGDEYRGGELPAWRICISGADDAAVYVGAATGRVRAVRTSSWRIYDLLWALHIMDYRDREDFNHWLVQLLAVLGLITIASGIALFFMTQKWSGRGTAKATESTL